LSEISGSCLPVHMFIDFLHLTVTEKEIKEQSLAEWPKSGYFIYILLCVIEE